jgi:hypothetical protein
MTMPATEHLWQDIDAPSDDFLWVIPERFNIGTACADDQPPASVTSASSPATALP